MPADLTPNMWHKIMEARAAVLCACSMTVIQNLLPRQATDDIVNDLLDQDSGVRGNRPESQPPTWADAKLCLRSTLRYCLALVEDAIDHPIGGTL